MLKLVGTDGKQRYSWNLEPGRYLVGRKSECDFSIPDSTVSRRHAEIVVSNDETCRIQDLGSHNGTVVNGNRISDETSLKEGDKIIFGQAEFKIAPEHERETRTKPAKTELSDSDPRNSVYLSIDEALRPLPTKVTELPDLLPTIFDMAKMLVLNEPKEVMLEKSLGMISKIIRAERLAILTVDEETNDLYTVASLLPDGRDPGAFELSRTIVREIVSNKNAILICDPEDDPRFAEQKSIIMSDLKSAVAVPLFDEGRVLGILYADTSNPLHRYDNDHLRVLATFGNIIASRLLNYELLEQREERQVMKAELKRASQIQKNLLVSTAPDFDKYDVFAFQEQSRSVGGDLYDMKFLKDGQFLFVVADVSGKGMGAALLMSNILASFRILYESNRFDLCSAVEKVSLQLYNYSRSGDFATLFAGLLDPETGDLCYVNAGHNPPLIVHPNGDLDYLATSGMMIGAFDFSRWDMGKINLAKDDLAVVFTDGVTEAQAEGEDAEQYGDERLEKLVRDFRNGSPREIAEHLMSDISGFVGDSPRSDDITLLLMKRTAE